MDKKDTSINTSTKPTGLQFKHQLSSDIIPNIEFPQVIGTVRPAFFLNLPREMTMRCVWTPTVDIFKWPNRKRTLVEESFLKLYTFLNILTKGTFTGKKKFYTHTSKNK